VIAFPSPSPQSKRNDYLLPPGSRRGHPRLRAAHALGGRGSVSSARRVWVTGLYAVLCRGRFGAGHRAGDRGSPSGAGPDRSGPARRRGDWSPVPVSVGRTCWPAGAARAAVLPAWGLFAAFYPRRPGGALLPAADSSSPARPFCRALGGARPLRRSRWRPTASGNGARSTPSTAIAPSQACRRRSSSGTGEGRWVLVEDWALPEARSVLGDAPTALTGRVGRGTIVLLGPLH
jgi:hypothetical protein